jgi:hypothetical protein
MEAFRAVIPPYPGSALIAPVRVPNPPLLNAADGIGAQAVQVARTYYGAHLNRYKEPFFPFSHNRDINRSRHHVLLCSAAELFVQHAIPPAGWCSFSFDVWTQYGGHTTPPPIAWALDVLRIERRRGWYRAESANYAGGQMYFGDAYRALVERYLAMRRVLLRDDPATVEACTNIVRAHFPGDTWARTLAVVRADAATAQDLVDQAVERGEFVW